jgi:two-component system cell cycle response regulator
MTARVLVVDDILPNVKVLSAKLLSEYYDVIAAYSGKEALEKIETEHPDIVLLDVMMPEMDGFEVCHRIKSNPATMHIPVVMVTALSDIADRVRGLEAGADDFLTKPVNDTALFARVKSLARLKMVIDEWRLRERTSDQLGVLQAASIDDVGDMAGARVLVVDDLPIEASRLEEILTGDQFVVKVLPDPTQLMQTVQNHDFDLIIISLTLSSEDGLRLCSQIRSSERTRQTPVLLVDDSADIRKTVRALDLGGNDYLLRPYDKAELKARVRTLLKRKRYQDKLRSNYETSLSMALVDSLTGLFNRRYFDAHFEKILEKSRRENFKPLGLLMLDIDKFKSINDGHGHPVGDEVLQELARRLTNSMRPSDLVARLGGEEFVIVLPESRPEQVAMIAERVRALIADKPFPIKGGAETLPVTTSIGATVTRSEPEQAGDILKRADDALYQAKQTGRNKVVMG